MRRRRATGKANGSDHQADQIIPKKKKKKRKKKFSFLTLLASGVTFWEPLLAFVFIFIPF
jgi:hypothetical protein